MKLIQIIPIMAMMNHLENVVKQIDKQTIGREKVIRPKNVLCELEYFVKLFTF